MTLRTCDTVVSDDVLEVVCGYLGASGTKDAMCISKDWREFLMTRMEFVVHEKSQSARDVFTPMRGEGVFTRPLLIRVCGCTWEVLRSGFLGHFS